jgi:uncharacterized protein
LITADNGGIIILKKLQLSDKTIFDGFFIEYPPDISELTFTNLFMWRKKYDFSFRVAHGYLCIIAEPCESEAFALIPVGPEGDGIHKAIKFIADYFSAKNLNLIFKKTTQKQLEIISKYVTSPENIVYDRDDCDYIYLTNDMIELKGKKYDGKRNHISRFMRENEFEFEIVGEAHIEECRRIMAEWCEERDCSKHKGLYCEKVAVNEMLDNFGALSYQGMIIKVNGRYEAFTTGEKLNADTAVIHIEKAKSSITGLYPYINRQFCDVAWSGTTYINREQDVGVEGIKKAKLSYNPIKLLDKYKIYIK